MSQHTALQLAYHRDGPNVVVDVNGELDLATAASLRHGLLDLIEGQGNLHVILDLVGLSFLDAAGLKVLIQARNHLLERGGSLALRSTSRPARRLLAITGLVSAFDIAGACGDGNEGVIDIRDSAASTAAVSQQAGPSDQAGAVVRSRSGTGGPTGTHPPWSC